MRGNHEGLDTGKRLGIAHWLAVWPDVAEPFATPLSQDTGLRIRYVTKSGVFC
nr:hypothetical protein [Acidobacterium sp. S8]